MKLRSCSVANFGVLRDAKYDFTDGLNVVLEDNGHGKSTLAAFIKAMFYGLASTTKRDLDANDRKRYTPWQGGAFGGSLVFETEDKVYRIQRSFGARASSDTFCLYDETTGLVSDDYSENIGEELFGVDAASYEKSVWHPQKAVTFGQSASLTARLSAGGDSADAAEFERVKKDLDGRIARYENKAHRGLLPDARAKKTDLEGKIHAHQQALARLADLSAQLDVLYAQQKQTRLHLEEVKARRAQIHAAAERLARLETWQMLSARVREGEENLAKLEETFGGSVPTAEEIRYMQGKLRQALSAREQSQTAMRMEDVSRLAALQEKFPEGVPDEEELQAMLSDASRLDQAQQRAEQAEAELVTRRARIADTFPEGVPTPEACAAAGQMAIAVLQQEKDAEKAAAAQEKQAQKKKKVLMIAAAALAVAGLGLLFVILWLGLALVVAGLGLVITANVLIHPAQAQAEYSPMREDLLHFLRRYEQQFSGEDILDGQLRVQMVTQRARQYEDLGVQLQDLRRREEAEAQQKLWFQNKLTAMGEDCSRGFTPAVTNLVDAASRYRALAQIRDESRTRMAEASKHAQALETELEAFCRRYAKDVYGQTEDVLPVLASRQQEYTAAQKALEKSRAELAAYEHLQNINKLSHERPIDPAERAELQALEVQLQEELSEISSRIGMMRKEAEDLSEYAPRLQSLQAEYDGVCEDIARYEQNMRTLQVTADYMQRAYDSLRASSLSLMQKGLQHYAALVTGNEAGALHIDADFTVTADVAGQLRAYGHFSRGQKDIFDICTRLALCDALFVQEKPFLVLDDPFANLDDANLARARVLLERLAEDRQILYLACHTSRA